MMGLRLDAACPCRHQRARARDLPQRVLRRPVRHRRTRQRGAAVAQRPPRRAAPPLPGGRQDYLAAERQARAPGSSMLGFYHSHPDHPAVPSQYDLDHAWPTFLCHRVGEARRAGGVARLAARTTCATTARSSTKKPSSVVDSRTMPVTIHIPTPLRAFTDKNDAVEVSGATVGEALQHLTTARRPAPAPLHAGRQAAQLRQRLRQRRGHPLPAEGTDADQGDGDTVSIIPSVAGGQGDATATLPALDSEEIRRYSRHLILREVGMEGQQKLKAAKVLCIGAGGLGSPVAMYLAAAGRRHHRHRRLRHRRRQQPAAPDPARHRPTSAARSWRRPRTCCTASTRT